MSERLHKIKVRAPSARAARNIEQGLRIEVIRSLVRLAGIVVEHDDEREAEDVFLALAARLRRATYKRRK